MKKHTIPTLLSASAFALMFTSCDQTDPVAEAEADKVEAKADYVEETAEAQADKIEALNDNNRADAVRDQGEAQAERLEERADQIRETDRPIGSPATGTGVGTTPSGQ